MSAIAKVVPHHRLHRNAVRGDGVMASKEFVFGNSTVIIHSDLAFMTREEQRHWFDQELEKKNPILMTIVQVAIDCLYEDQNEVK